MASAQRRNRLQLWLWRRHAHSRHLSSQMRGQLDPACIVRSLSLDLNCLLRCIYWLHGSTIDSFCNMRHTYIPAAVIPLHSHVIEAVRPDEHPHVSQSSNPSPLNAVGRCQGSDVAVLGLADRKPSL